MKLALLSGVITRDKPYTIKLYAALTLAISFAILAWNIGQDGIGAPYSDPIGQIPAQDESLYVSSSMQMVRDGDWLTPKVLGRPFFQKPPLLMWLSALSIKLFGLSLFTVRLPALLMGACGIASVFVWSAHARTPLHGIFAASLVLTSPFWQSLSRMAYTDILVSAFSTLSLTVVALDFQMQKRSTRFLCGSFGAAAILSKGVAGLLLFGALFVFALLLPRAHRLRPSALIETLLFALGVTAPWHVYQAVQHPQWFWADYIQQQILGVGLGTQSLGVFDRTPLFYLERILQMDPTLLLLLLAAPLLIRFPRLRADPRFLLSVCWLVTVMIAMSVFRAKNLPYMALLLPPLSIAGTICFLDLLRNRPSLILLALCLTLTAKATLNHSRSPIRPSSPPVEGARAMRDYYARNRGTELFLVDADDEFYSATLPLTKPRYCFVDPTGKARMTIPHYAFLGIVLSAKDFLTTPTKFESRLRTWGANPANALGSAIALDTRDQLMLLIRGRQESDFYLPSDWHSVIEKASATHISIPFSAKRTFLLSRSVVPSTKPQPPIPSNW